MYAKQKKIKIEDSNMALYGSKLHKDVRKAAAESEEEYKGAGKEVGTEVWRVEKLAIKKWPKEEYGHFFDGDSFIVLRTYKQAESDKLLYDVHFWLGKDTSQDEAGTAAYKTVELDDLLDDIPVQYREVQGSESTKFKKLFPNMKIFEGGIETGFKHVEAENYVARLLQIKGKKDCTVEMVKMELASLNDGDVFLLDAGLKLYQWNGTRSNPNERRKCNQVVETIKAERNKSESVILDGLEDNEEFWNYFGGKPEKVAEPTEDIEVESQDTLWKLSDAKGKLSLDLVAEGVMSQSLLNNSDVYIYDVGYQIYVWIGKQASKEEKKGAMLYAMSYIKQQGLPVHTPIIRIVEGCICPEFDRHFDGTGSYIAVEPDNDSGPVKWAPKAKGSFEITVLEAKELKDVQMIGKMDPFAKVTFGKKSYRGETHSDADQTPKWENAKTHKFEFTGLPEVDDEVVSIEIVNDNLLVNSRIGEGTIKVEDIMNHKEETKQWVTLTRKGGTQPAGEVYVQTKFIPPIAITVHEAKELPSVQLFGKMDPFAKMKICKYRFQTPVHSNGSKNPKWDSANTFTFNVGMLPEKEKDTDKAPQLHLKVQNKNFVKDKIINYLLIPIEDIIKQRDEKPNELVWKKCQKGKENTGAGGEVLISVK